MKVKVIITAFVLKTIICFSQNGAIIVRNRFFNNQELRKSNVCIFDSAFVRGVKNELTDRMKSKLDTISTFLTSHKEITLSVNCYYIENKKSSTMTAYLKAQSVCEFLVHKGVSKDRLKPWGYETIKKPLNEKKKDRLCELEFKILAVE